MAVSAKEVQELRKISGAGMMECKTALSESNGDLDLAFKLLREKGIAKAEKKSSRDANEGLIGIKCTDNKAAIIEINSETDFVSRNAEFQNLVRSILDITLSNFSDKDEMSKQSTDLINEAVAKIGENIVFRRCECIEGNVFSYIHNSAGEGLGKIGVLVDLDTELENANEVGKNMCMHIAALNPVSISKNDFDLNLIESEKEIIKQQLKDSGKSDDILAKMMDGKISKFINENTLLGQKFVIDPSVSVSEYLDKISKEKNVNISIKKFIRFEIGS